MRLKKAWREMTKYKSYFNIIKLLIISLCFGSLNACTNFSEIRPLDPNLERARADILITSSIASFKEILHSSETTVPQQLLNSAKCVAVFPEVLKAAFIGGAQYGQGIVSCKDKNSLWSPVAFLKIKGASIGWQIGADSSEAILFFVGKKATASLLTNQVTLGGDVSISAGPVGRGVQSSTNAEFDGIYSYTKSKGLFAGVSLNGSILSNSDSTNMSYYSKDLSTADLLFNNAKVDIPKNVTKFLRELP